MDFKLHIGQYIFWYCKKNNIYMSYIFIDLHLAKNINLNI